MPTLNAAPIENGFYSIRGHYDLGDDVLFVFGSNYAGIHGAGAAKAALLRYGAFYGQGTGRQRQCYAVPTKDENIETLSLAIITTEIEAFIEYTRQSNLSFYVTPVGTGLAGYRHEQIAPLFKGAQRCWFPDIWFPYLSPCPPLERKKKCKITQVFLSHSKELMVAEKVRKSTLLKNHLKPKATTF